MSSVAVDSWRIFFDSCCFNDCTVDISTHIMSIIVGCAVNKHLVTAVVCSKESQVWVRSSAVAIGAIDARNKVQLHFDLNQFTDGFIVMWGSASVALD
jgi:hypothetical protein